MLSVAIAFWLYGTLDGVTAAFDDALVSMTSAARLRTQSRINVRVPALPLVAIARASRACPACATSACSRSSAAITGIPSSSDRSLGDRYRPVDTIGSFDVDDAHLEAMRRTRTGAIIGPELVSRYGWKIGDRVTVRSPIWSQGGRLERLDVRYRRHLRHSRRRVSGRRQTSGSTTTTSTKSAHSPRARRHVLHAARR